MSPSPLETGVRKALEESLDALERALGNPLDPARRREVGRVRSVSHGIAVLEGLPGVCLEEVVVFSGGGKGLVYGLEPEAVQALLLDVREPAAGTEVRRSGRVLEVPIGPSLLGRVVDPLGRPLDGGAPPVAQEHGPIEKASPGPAGRAPVRDPLQTGIKIVDALVPVGRGQRELILGDRQTGKTSLALDALRNQEDVVAVWCSVGQSADQVATVLEHLRRFGALSRTVVVVAGSDSPPGMQYLAPFAATTMAEFFRDRGQDALVVYDDLSHHARAYREISLLMRRPPGREAYPGDIFYLHSRLLERSTRLIPELGGGSLTALPILQTEAGALADYIPTNLVSITDGQIVLSADLVAKGFLPAVDVGLSVSRVGADAQAPGYRVVAADLRLACAQFAELEMFSRFSTRLDATTRQALTRGRAVREVLRQPRNDPWKLSEQMAILLAAVEGILDGVDEARLVQVQQLFRERLPQEFPDLEERLRSGQKLGASDLEDLKGLARRALTRSETPCPESRI